MLFGLIATVMIGFVGNAQTFEKFEKYGTLHNEYVTLFLNSGKKVSDYKNLYEFVNDYYEIVSKKYPQIDKNVFISEFKSTFLEDFISNGDSIITFKNLLKKMKEENKISKNVYEKMCQIIDNRDDYTKLLKLTDEVLNLELSSFERNSISVFKATLENSNTLWTNLSSKMKPGSMTIIGDCIGAFVFCYIPPVAALAAGAISLAIHNSDNP